MQLFQNATILQFQIQKRFAWFQSGCEKNRRPHCTKKSCLPSLVPLHFPILFATSWMNSSVFFSSSSLLIAFCRALVEMGEYYWVENMLHDWCVLEIQYKAIRQNKTRPQELTYMPSWRKQLKILCNNHSTTHKTREARLSYPLKKRTVGRREN
jgi:hypothetical protein